MCVVSAIGDNYKNWFERQYPNIYPNFQNITREEFEQLKKEVKELRILLVAAKRFDEKTNQPNCEMEEKIEFIKKLAEMVGVNMNEVFR